jgi:hypothetical protein
VVKIVVFMGGSPQPFALFAPVMDVPDGGVPTFIAGLSDGKT